MLLSRPLHAQEYQEIFLLIPKYEKEHDDYKIIMIKAIADRLAEAFAEKLHHMIRVNYWGYSSEKDLAIDDLIKEKYAGIRPALC